MRDELVRFVRRLGDVGVTAVIVALTLVQIWVGDASERDRLSAVAIALVLGAAAAVRTRAPLLLLGLMLAVTVAPIVVPPLADVYVARVTAIGLFLLLAVYSGAAHTAGRATMAAGGLILAIFLADMVLNDPAALTPEVLVFNLLLFGAPWVAGRAVRRSRVNDLRLEDEKARAAAAIVEERARIARELHDVVAHAISVMVIQARGGRRVLDSDPSDARGAFDSIERSGEQAIGEMRRLLGMLRSRDEVLALAPRPSLTDVGRLVEEVRRAGLPVQLVVEGEPRELPPGVDLSAFRIVQEALTNALKHAGPAEARVLLRYRPEALEIEVADDGVGSSAGAGSGYGLIGMRERVSVYGGELEAGKRPEGGYALRVRLPVGSARA